MINFLNELSFQSSRSGGKGGQNVNKVETRVEVRWNVAHSLVLSSEQKERVLLKLSKQISKDGFLIVQCSDTRSQLENKAIAIERIHSIVAKALLVAKKRKATKTPKAAIEKRLTGKKIIAEKKSKS